MKLLSQRTLVAILAAAVLSTLIPARAFEVPLSDEQIREAYFIGKENPDRIREFLQPYRHTFPAPESGPQISLIEIETPFVLIADQISRTGLTYHAPDAVQDYLGKPEQLHVHVEIAFTATYPPRNTDVANLPFWDDFKVHLKQKSEVPPSKVIGRPIFLDWAYLWVGST